MSRFNNKVYFMVAEEVNRIKIGYSRSLYARLQTNQSSSPCKLKIVGWLYGGKTQEQQLHDKFKKDRLHGEWFTYSQEIRDYVKHHENSIPLPWAQKIYDWAYFYNKWLFYNHKIDSMEARKEAEKEWETVLKSRNPKIG